MSQDRIEWDIWNCSVGPAGHCPTCADEGVPARIVALDADQALATVEADGQQMEIATDLLDQVAIGDIVLVHLGVAIARLEGAA